jgi:hypothetical protein
MPDLSAASAALSDLAATLAAPYGAVRSSFVDRLTSAASDYLLEGLNLRVTVNAAQRAMVESYGEAADLVSGGSGGLEPADLAFFNSEVSAERDHIETLWADLKLQRTIAPGEAAQGDLSVPADRIEMFARSMDAMFNELVARGNKNAMGTWQLGDAEKHCVGHGSCTWLDGQRHRMSWFLQKDYIPRKPGAAQVCGGWHCQCSIVDDQGNELMAA